jgi:hypothetical protein
MKGRSLLVLALVVVLLAAISSLAQAHTSRHTHAQDDAVFVPTEDDNQLLAEIRRATADFQDVEVAEEAGYGSFLDCMSDPDEGGMGQHYVHGEFVGDTVIDALQPESLVYEPQEDGSMILIGFEYIAFQEQWDAENDEPPTLMGQEFVLVENLADLPPFYALHLWVYNYNPNGPFARYSPNVFCPDGAM